MSELSNVRNEQHSFPKVSVSLKRTISDGNFGSTSIGVMMEDDVQPGEKKSAVLERLIQQEATFIGAKFDEFNNTLR